MTDINSMRLAAAMALARTGLGPEVATCAALALHPLDDSVQPSRAFEREIRRRSTAFAHELKSLAEPTDALAIQATDKALRGYYSLAVRQSETHYVRRYDEALELLSQQAAPAAPPGGEAATTISRPRQVQIASPPELVGEGPPGSVRIRLSLSLLPGQAWIDRLVDLAPDVEVEGAVLTASIPKEEGVKEALDSLAAAIDRTNVLVAVDEEIDSWWLYRSTVRDDPAEPTEGGTGDTPPPISSNLTPTQQGNRNLPALAVILLWVVVMVIAIVENQASTRSTPTAPSPPVAEEADEVEKVEKVESHWVNIERLETGDCFVGSVGPAIDRGTWERVLVIACDTPGTHEVVGVGADGSRKAISMDTPEGKRIVLYVPTG